MTGDKRPILMAVIGAPHGVRGEVRVKAHTADPLSLADYSPLHDSSGRVFEIEGLRPQKDMLVVRFASVRDRDAAEALKGTELFVDRDRLGADLEEDEFFQADLVGLLVRDVEGNAYGRVAALHDFGAGDILEIRRSGGSVMIPFTRAAAPKVDVEGGEIVIDPVAAGLLDEEGGE